MAILKKDKKKIYYSKPNRVMKSENGDLFLKGVKVKNNLPFPLLQTYRIKLLREGHTKKTIKIKYHED